jgi:hypothetical protein
MRDERQNVRLKHISIGDVVWYVGRNGKEACAIVDGFQTGATGAFEYIRIMLDTTQIVSILDIKRRERPGAEDVLFT